MVAWGKPFPFTNRFLPVILLMDALQGISVALIKTGRYAEAKKTLATWKSFPGNSFEVKRLQEVLGSIISPVVGLGGG